jgi:hypothetical protein
MIDTTTPPTRSHVRLHGTFDAARTLTIRFNADGRPYRLTIPEQAVIDALANLRDHRTPLGQWRQGTSVEHDVLVTGGWRTSTRTGHEFGITVEDPHSGLVAAEFTLAAPAVIDLLVGGTPRNGTPPTTLDLFTSPNLWRYRRRVTVAWPEPPPPSYPTEPADAYLASITGFAARHGWRADVPGVKWLARNVGVTQPRFTLSGWTDQPDDPLPDEIAALAVEVR